MNRLLWLQPVAILLLLSGCVRAEFKEGELIDLVDSKHKQFAPADITRQLVALEHEGLDDDRRQHLWVDEDRLFAVRPINLDDDGITDYLAYPASYLPSLFGAHSVSCWIFRGHKDHHYELLTSQGRYDAVEILPHKTNGLYDINMLYGMKTEVYTFTFDGHQYVESPEVGER